MSGDEDFRVLIFGTKGSCQFIISNTMLKKDVHNVEGFIIAQSQKHKSMAFNRKSVLVNTPNLSEHDTSEKQLKMEFKKAICMSSPGPYAILFALDLNNLSGSLIHLQLILKHFGECILRHLIIVVCHEEEMDDLLVQERVNMSIDFKQLIDKCDQRYHLFNLKKAHIDESVVTGLLDKIDEMVVEKGYKYYSNIQYEDAEARIKREEMFMLKRRHKEMQKKREELMERFAGKELDKEIQRFEANIKRENRDNAERQVALVLGCAVRTVDSAVAVVKGALVGGLCGAVMGLEGIAFGVVCGTFIGGVTGGAAGALWRLITDTAAHYRRNH